MILVGFEDLVFIEVSDSDDFFWVFVLVRLSSVWEFVIRAWWGGVGREVVLGLF